MKNNSLTNLATKALNVEIARIRYCDAKKQNCENPHYEAGVDYDDDISKREFPITCLKRVKEYLYEGNLVESNDDCVDSIRDSLCERCKKVSNLKTELRKARRILQRSTHYHIKKYGNVSDS